jgi:exodeoxyribonuclease VII large subunit
MSKSGFFDFHEQVRPKRRIEQPAPARPAPTTPSADASIVRPPGPQPITVSQLTSRIDRTLRAGIPETVYVRGEVSNLRPNQASGHVYFTMKDANNCIDCVMWKSDAARLKFTPTAGIELLATGTVGVYGKQGKYQLYVTSLRPLGKGALELAFQQLRARLETQGMFAPQRKKPLPAYARTVVLITGANSAALQDMLKVLRRYAFLRVLVYPVPVQGDGAAARIAAAIQHVSQRGQDVSAQVIILGRGGGSLEDLWAFNEEAVARAIAASRLPIITGIGHEVDTTIADLVADYHAHTPTEAAQVVAAQWRTARDEVDRLLLRLRRSTIALLRHARQRLTHIERHESFRRPMDRINSMRQLLDDRQRALTMAVTTRLHENQWRVHQMGIRLDRHMPAALNRLRERVSKMQQSLLAALTARMRRAGERVTRLSAKLIGRHPKHGIPVYRQRLAALSDRLNRSLRSSLVLRKQGLDALARQLQAVGPENVLKRGYTITTRKKDGVLLRSSTEVRRGDRLITRFADGQSESIAEDPRQPELFE